MVEVKRKSNGQWAKGTCGNPKGRPRKEETLIEYIRRKLCEICPYDAEQRTWLEALADAELRYALTDTSARADLFNRLIGKAKEVADRTGAEGEPLIATFKLYLPEGIKITLKDLNAGS